MAKQDGIKVLIVNMPLTKTNMALMPEGYYQEYLQVLQTTNDRYHCQLLDLNNDKSFETADFRDTAHMNASGGRKLIDRIVDRISEQPMRTALKKEVISPDKAVNRTIAGEVTGL
jgi:hypothetical protein